MLLSPPPPPPRCYSSVFYAELFQTLTYTYYTFILLLLFCLCYRRLSHSNMCSYASQHRLTRPGKLYTLCKVYPGRRRPEIPVSLSFVPVGYRRISSVFTKGFMRNEWEVSFQIGLFYPVLVKLTVGYYKKRPIFLWWLGFATTLRSDDTTLFIPWYLLVPVCTII